MPGLFFPAASACPAPYSLFTVHYMPHIFLIIPRCLPHVCKSCSLHFCRLVFFFFTLLPVWAWYCAEIISESRCSSDDCEALHDFNLSPHFRTVDSHSFHLRWKRGSRQGGDATANAANSARCSAIMLIRCGTSCPVWKPLTLSDLQERLSGFASPCGLYDSVQANVIRYDGQWCLLYTIMLVDELRNEIRFHSFSFSVCK